VAIAARDSAEETLGISALRVLDTLSLFKAPCREPRDAAGENVAATKHGFKR